MTTITCANGFYQNGKGFRDRRLEHKLTSAAHRAETPEEEAERRNARKKKLAWDAFSLGVCAIGVNNLRIGWQRAAEHRRNLHEAERREWERKHRKEEMPRPRKERYTVEEPDSGA